MSEETANDNAPEEEFIEKVDAPNEVQSTAEEAPAPEAAPEAAAPEAAPEAVTPGEVAAPETAVASSSAPVEEAAPAVEEKSDKLKRAEEILRSNAPVSTRGEDMENAFEKVVHINRCSKVVKGGRRFSFSALVVSGDRDGRVGFGFGKAQEVSECIKKSSEASRKDMVKVNITGNTIPHPVIGEHGGGRVMLRPASPGTGLIAGGGVRAVVEAAGIKDVLAKSMGSNNQANVVKATINALEQLRTKEEIYSLRGKKLADRKAL